MSEPMRIEMWPLSRIRPFDKNARVIPASAVEKVALSLRTFGWRQSLVVDTEGVLVVGHVRRLAAIKNGWTEAPVHVAHDLTPAQIRAYRLMDNRSADETSWDESLLSVELLDLYGLGEFDLSLTGFDGDELSKLLDQRTGLTDEDDVPEVPVAPVTKLGDLWLLGDHKLLCGDSMDLASVERLMARQKADMCYQDPPYGLNVVKVVKSAAQSHSEASGNAGGSLPFRGKKGRVHGLARKAIIRTNLYAPIIGDESTDTAVRAYEICSSLQIETLIFWGANYYADRLPPGRCWIVWDKETTGTFADVELAWTNLNKVARLFRHQWSGLMKASERGQARVHPTQKPVALAEWVFLEFGKPNDLVLDLFLGSGSTLIACEKTGRSCLGMELSEAYCDVVIQRWESYAGQQTILESTGQTFEQVRFGRRLAAEDAIKEEIMMSQGEAQATAPAQTE